MATLQVAILVFNEVEVLDFAGPFEVFSVASRVALRDGDAARPPFEPFLCSKSGQGVRARHGLQVTPDRSLAETPHPDVLIVPGGVVGEPLDDSEVIGWLRAAHPRTVVTASVCTGAFLLARAGLLDGLAATTHWEDIAAFRRFAPGVEVREDAPFVDQGRVVTSAGVSSGIDMSFHLVARLGTEELAQRAARQIEYPYPPR